LFGKHYAIRAGKKEERKKRLLPTCGIFLSDQTSKSLLTSRLKARKLEPRVLVACQDNGHQKIKLKVVNYNA